MNILQQWAEHRSVQNLKDEIFFVFMMHGSPRHTGISENKSESQKRKWICKWLQKKSNNKVERVFMLHWIISLTNESSWLQSSVWGSSRGGKEHKKHTIQTISWKRVIKDNNKTNCKCVIHVLFKSLNYHQHFFPKHQITQASPNSMLTV